MTKNDASRFKARWALVNSTEIEELRSTSLDRKLRQLAALMASAKAFGFDSALADQETHVRRRWIRIKKAHRV
ncbi:MAG: hypothetical protein ACREV2_09660 [Burkholderiales bacterium]